MTLDAMHCIAKQRLPKRFKNNRLTMCCQSNATSQRSLIRWTNCF